MRSAHVTASLILLGAGLLGGACGGGAKGGSSHGVCVTGDTRACVGPGACNGAQACLPDHSGFGPCDCGGGGAPSTGGAGGGGATGGASGAAGAQDGGGGVGAGGGNTTGGAGGSDASAGAGGVDASAGAGGAGAGGVDAGASGGSSGSGGAAGWGNPGPNDSPCPTGSYINCSHQCGPYDAQCVAAACGGINSAPYAWDGTPPTITFRLPADPGHVCSQCTTPPYDLVVVISDSNWGGFVRVQFDGGGWVSSRLFYSSSGSSKSCPASADMNAGCQLYTLQLCSGLCSGVGQGIIYIAPYDPSHPDNTTTGTPARNVTLTIGDAKNPVPYCP